MKPKIFFLFLLTFSIIHITSSIAEVRYVSKTGSSTPPYTSWETAADSIQKCINISQFGDTIYVANGVYKEQVIMIPGLSLIGAGTDSCIVDTRDFAVGDFNTISVADSCLLKGFYILCSNDFNIGGGIYTEGQNSLITENKVSSANAGIVLFGETYNEVYTNLCFNNRTGIYISNSHSSVIRKNIISVLGQEAADGISIRAFNGNYSPIIDSNYIEVNQNGDFGIIKRFGSNPIIKNNTIVLKRRYGIVLLTGNTATVYNNLILAEGGSIGIENTGVPNLQLYNNYVIGNVGTGISVGGAQNIVKNNVVTNSTIGIEKWSTQPIPLIQYNNVWNTDIPYSGLTPDTTNISVDPMIVNDDTTQGELDFHLQKYSPLIDAGDPNILDRDGSRSDIGLYGGPYGWTYTYNDLAPRPPHNITAVVEEGLIKLTWNKNTEADFSFYRIYRDTVSILIYDSTKIAGETSDTVFYDNLPITNTAKKYYYLITAFDNQGNQSAPGEEVNVTVTGMTEHPPIGDDGYRLLSNYPNPFNPSTIIPYRLKESGYVKLYIYDIKGELVRVLVNQWQNRGYYEVVFNPNTEERQRANSYEIPVGKTYSDIATGVYIYQIMVKSENNIPVFGDTGKMILLK